MIELIFTGIGYGLLLSIMVGPAFFVLIETSITKGVKSALFLDLGVFICDLIYVTLAFFFANLVHDLLESDNKHILKIAGGGFFIFLGIVNILKAKKKITPRQKIKPGELTASTYIMMFVKGFAINALNPGVLFYWLTLISVLPAANPALGLTTNQTLLIHLSLVFLTFFGIDVLKIFGAKKLQEILTPTWMQVVNLVLGIILSFFGILFVINGIVMLVR
ncbi:MAG: LysE family transporter [Crocinitomicaceae bacterium]|nr:LysE family transporter [Crocinitomicaceae bacterium]